MKAADCVRRLAAMGCLMGMMLAALCSGRVMAAVLGEPVITADSLLTSTRTQEVLLLRASVTPLENGEFRWRFEIRNLPTNHQRITQMTLGGWPSELPPLTNLLTPSGWSVRIVRDATDEGPKINLSVLPNESADLRPGGLLLFGFDLPVNATTRTGWIGALGTLGFSGATLGYEPPAVHFTIDGLTVSPEAPTACESASGMVRIKPQAPAGGRWVTLKSSDPAAVSVEERVWFAPGETEKRFPVTLRPVRAATVVTVTASLEESRATTALTVQPPGLRSLFLSNPEAPAGSTLTAILARQCPSPWPLIARVESDNPIVKVPSCPVTIPAGQESVTFPVETWGLKTEAEFSLITVRLTAAAPVGEIVASLRVRASPQFACSQDICPGYTVAGNVLTLVAGEGGVFLFRGVGRGFVPTLRLTVAGAASEEYHSDGSLVEITKHLVAGGPHWIEMLNDDKPAPAEDATVFVQRLNHPENARPLAPAQTLGGLLPRPAQTDSYVLGVEVAGERIALQAQSMPGLPLRIRLYDPDGALIATANSEEGETTGRFPGRSVTLSQAGTVAGKYTCLVGSEDGVGIGSYAITRGFTTPCSDPASP